MNFNKNSVFGLWIKNSPNCLNLESWKSWIRLGYQVTLYTDDPSLIPNEIRSRVIIKNPSHVCFWNDLTACFSLTESNLLQFTDLWRFMYLYHYGGTWLDSDLYLVKRLSNENIIISSEHTLQAGGRKSKDLYRPNIGVLRFPPHNPFLKEVIDTCMPTTSEDENPSKHDTSKMLKYIKVLKKKKWASIRESVVAPEIFCPVPYPFAKELFLKHRENANIKYGLKFNYANLTTCGFHLWHNIATNQKKIDFNNLHPQCLFNHIINGAYWLNQSAISDYYEEESQ